MVDDSNKEFQIPILAAYSPVLSILFSLIAHSIGMCVLSTTSSGTLGPILVLISSFTAIILAFWKKSLPVKHSCLPSQSLLISQCFVTSICVIMMGVKFVEVGAPLFDSIPDMARMEFVISGGTPFKIFSNLAVLLYLLHLYYYLNSTGWIKFINFFLVIIIATEFILLGSKSQMANLILFGVWGSYARGFSGSFGKIFKYVAAIIPIVLLNYYLVVGADFNELVGLVLLRMSSIQANGMLISFSLPGLGYHDVIASLQNIVDKILGNVPYVVSLANIVFAKYTNSDPYSTPFAMTITAFSDFYLSFGYLGCVALILAIPFVIRQILQRALLSQSFFFKAFWMVSCFLFTNLLFKGGIAGVLWGEFLPFIGFSFAYLGASRALQWSITRRYEFS